MEGGVCANHLHLCILFYLDLLFMLQLVISSVTVEIHHPSGPVSFFLLVWFWGNFPVRASL